MKFFILTFIYAFCILAGSISWILGSLPDVKSIRGCLRTNMYNVWLCEKDSNYAYLNHISPYFKNVTLASEDAAFYSHNGFDWDEMRKSFFTNWASFRFARGGSTISQQLVKNVFLYKDKTLVRKVKEAILTTQLEEILSKDKILEKYLNVIELGPNIYGAAKASQYYFNKSPENLNLLESAYLTYLIPNPVVHSRTFSNKQLTPYSRYRIIDLCYRVYRFRKITAEQYTAAKELVDRFPWTDLTSGELARLSHTGLISSPITDASPADLPEVDENVPVVDPSDEELIPREEMVSPEEIRKSERSRINDSPFDEDDINGEDHTETVDPKTILDPEDRVSGVVNPSEPKEAAPKDDPDGFEP